MIHALKVESSTILRFEKNVQIEYKKNEKGGHRKIPTLQVSYLYPTWTLMVTGV